MSSSIKLPISRTNLSKLTKSLPGWARTMAVLAVVGYALWATYGSPDSKDVTEAQPTPTPQSTSSAVLSDQDGWFELDRVVDGDTIRVKTTFGSQAVRLIGVDTPEVVDPRKPVECFGREASEAAKKLLAGQKVMLVADDTQGASDRYRRWLRYVYVQEGQMLNLMLIQQGFAHEYTHDQPYLHQQSFKQAQHQAQQSNSGLWGAECQTVK